MYATYKRTRQGNTQWHIHPHNPTHTHVLITMTCALTNTHHTRHKNGHTSHIRITHKPMHMHTYQQPEPKHIINTHIAQLHIAHTVITTWACKTHIPTSHPIQQAHA